LNNPGFPHLSYRRTAGIYCLTGPAAGAVGLLGLLIAVAAYDFVTIPGEISSEDAFGGALFLLLAAVVVFFGSYWVGFIPAISTGLFLALLSRLPIGYAAQIVGSAIFGGMVSGLGAIPLMTAIADAWIGDPQISDPARLSSETWWVFSTFCRGFGLGLWAGLVCGAMCYLAHQKRISETVRGVAS
jgi:hypothetical protein